MKIPGFVSKTTLLIAASAFVFAYSPAPMSDLDLLACIEEFEVAIHGQPRETVQQLLRVHARTFKGQVVNVPAAVTASRYTRENLWHEYSHPPSI